MLGLPCVYVLGWVLRWVVNYTYIEAPYWVYWIWIKLHTWWSRDGGHKPSHSALISSIYSISDTLANTTNKFPPLSAFYGEHVDTALDMRCVFAQILLTSPICEYDGFLGKRSCCQIALCLSVDMFGTNFTYFRGKTLDDAAATVKWSAFERIFCIFICEK